MWRHVSDRILYNDLYKTGPQNILSLIIVSLIVRINISPDNHMGLNLNLVKLTNACESLSLDFHG